MSLTLIQSVLPLVLLILAAVVYDLHDDDHSTFGVFDALTLALLAATMLGTAGWCLFSCLAPGQYGPV
jgi:hypothetical protein